MSVAGDFYRTQADQCEREAAAAALPLLRDKYLRAQRAWQMLADRAALTDRARDRG